LIPIFGTSLKASENRRIGVLLGGLEKFIRSSMVLILPALQQNLIALLLLFWMVGMINNI